MATEKKNAKTKNNSSTSPSLHPPYFQMISEAINTMKDRTGSSQPAIAKFIEENYTKHKLPPNFKKMLSVQLKRFVKSEKLVKVKNSYKVSAVEKAKKPSKNAPEKSSPSQKKKNATKKETTVAKETVEKAKKTKRLSQVKTPPVLKKTTKMAVKKAGTPAKRKAGPKTVKAPAKKAKN